MQAPYALLEDDVVIRETLLEYPATQSEFRCVAAVGSVEELLAALAAGRPASQLLVLDIGWPGRSGIEGLPLIWARLPEVQVLMLSVYPDTTRILAAL